MRACFRESPKMRPKKTGIDRLLAASHASMDGIAATFREEAAFRQELAAGAVLVALLPLLDRSGLENAVMAGSLLLVLMVELLNTGIEKAIDRVGYEDHPLSKFAKDAGSAAVLVSLLNVPVTWGLILLG